MWNQLLAEMILQPEARQVADGHLHFIPGEARGIEKVGAAPHGHKQHNHLHDKSGRQAQAIRLVVFDTGQLKIGLIKRLLPGTAQTAIN